LVCNDKIGTIPGTFQYLDMTILSYRPVVIVGMNLSVEFEFSTESNIF
jgi:hypothetical protein